MSQATRARPCVRAVTLNSDGERHPLENGLAIFTLIAGLVAFTFGFDSRPARDRFLARRWPRWWSASTAS